MEEACANAFPSWRELRLQGWSLRAAGGSTRRNNSVNPLHAAAADPSGLVEVALRAYGRLKQPALFRIPDLLEDAGKVLDGLGFLAEGETLTLAAASTAMQVSGCADVALASEPTPTWLAAWRDMRPDVDAAAATAYRRSVNGILVPSCFACRRVDGQPVSVAYAAVDRGIAVIESVVTHADHRGRGYAHDVLRTLLAWGASLEARTACVQVQADNTGGRRLYASINIDRQLSRYHYRRAPPAR